MVSANSNRYSDRNSDRNDNASRYESRGSFSREQRHDSTRNFESRSNEYKDTLEIYPDKVGSVIGRGGATINGLQDKFNVKVNIDKNHNYNGKATVSVSGARDDVTNTIQNIKELVGDSNESQQDSYGSRQQNNSWGGSSQQQQNGNDAMDYEPIDWQAAARESVSFSFSQMRFGFFYVNRMNY